MTEGIPAGREATGSGLSALRRFAAPPPNRAAETAEKCELCGEILGEEHPHLVDLRERSISCACTACALLFDRPGGDRYRKVPDRVRVDPGSPLTEAEWTELAIPVAVAFFFVNSDEGRVIASYPSPAGVTESELDLAHWDRLRGEHPLLDAPEADVEAILVFGSAAPGAAADAVSEADTGGGGIETFLVPIDVCYSLAGSLRMDWHGFDGGPEVRKVLAGFLTDLRERARPLAPAPG